ncbi:hypothetical protein RIF29_40531 [Crotalaria pallida]|uniref:La-related protein 6A n=1 Tax=Crotalaria pallida TaxID=3830 RepID=A0AAN9E5P6_CROPI
MEGGAEVLPPTAASSSSPPPLPPGPDPLAPPPLDPDIHALTLISDEEHHLLDEVEIDHEHDHDHDHEEEEQQDHDHAAQTGGVSLDDLKLKIIKQVEYYFSDENLPTDKYLLGFIKRNKEGYVPISVIASFRKMKKLTRDHSFIVAALKESSLLVVSGDGKRVKRFNPQIQLRDHKLCTVVAENLPEDHSKENINRIFSEAGNVKRISIHNPRPASESGKHIKQEWFISSKLHALVEYETVEAAEKAVAILNDEQDWRNGLHVKLLKRMVKHGHKKQTRKASDTEKNSSSHVSEHTGDDENHSSNEHHEDTHDEEDGEHMPKDKGGQRYRNQGRSRKNKYRATNGMGHGSTSSTQSIEASKPPPGPRMPDGTRGFAIGRGRPPPVPAPN